MDENQLNEYTKNKTLNPLRVDEQPLDESQAMKLKQDLIFQQIIYRYNHEKNIFYFLIYTVKKIQGFIEIRYFEPMHKELFNCCILIMLKVKTLNQKQELFLD